MEEAGVVFTSTTEFSRLLHADRGEGEGAAAEGGAGTAGAAAGAVAPLPPLPDAPGAMPPPPPPAAARKRKRWMAEHAEEAAASSSGGGAWVDLDRGGAGVRGGEGADTEEEEEEEEGGEEGGSDEGSGEDGEGASTDIITGQRQQPTSGLAGTMSMLFSMGALGRKEEMAGRAKDARPQWNRPGSDPAPHVKLDYRDESGYQLTPKEAYRRISYAFHGHDPSKTTRDKRIKRMEREKGAAQGASAEAVLSHVDALRRAQEAKGQAHIKLE